MPPRRSWHHINYTRAVNGTRSFDVRNCHLFRIWIWVAHRILLAIRWGTCGHLAPSMWGRGTDGMTVGSWWSLQEWLCCIKMVGRPLNIHATTHITLSQGSNVHPLRIRFFYMWTDYRVIFSGKASRFSFTIHGYPYCSTPFWGTSPRKICGTLPRQPSPWYNRTRFSFSIISVIQRLRFNM